MRYSSLITSLCLVLSVAAFAPLPTARLPPNTLNKAPTEPFSIRSTTASHFRVGLPSLYATSSKTPKPRRRRLRKRISRALTSVAFGLSIAFGRAPALASSLPKEELRANDIIINSLKPGISAEEAEQLSQGDIAETDQDEGAEVVLGQESKAEQVEEEIEKPIKKMKMKRQSVYDYGDDEYLEEDDEIDFEFEGDVKESDVKAAPDSQQSFAMETSSGPTKKMYATATFSILVIPVTWLQTREFLRCRREQQYVEKGLAILEAQKAEYFNVTSTTDDSDIEDELKDLKKDDDDDDDDDEGSDDDDEDDDEDGDEDDDEDEDDRPSRPKRPRGGGDDDGGDSSGGGGGDDGPPSGEDVDRLNRMFGKS